MVVAVQVLKALLVSLMLAASAYAIAKLNLFGLETSSDRVADGVYQRVTAADYGADRKGQNAISVVYPQHVVAAAPGVDSLALE